MDGDLPLGFVTAHDKAVRPALSAILESAFAANRSFRVRRQTPEGLQDKKLKKKKKNACKETKMDSFRVYQVCKF